MNEPLTIGYAGNLQGFIREPRPTGVLKWFWTYRHKLHLSRTRSSYYLAHAVAAIKHEVTPAEIQFRFWGDIHARNMMLFRKLNVDDYFSISGYLPKSESTEKSKELDVMFLPLEMGDEEHGPLFIPGKVFDYIRLGKPILFLGDVSSDAGKILSKSGLMVQADPNNPDRIASRLKELIDLKQLGKLSEKYYRKEGILDELSFLKRAKEIEEELK